VTAQRVASLIRDRKALERLEFAMKYTHAGFRYIQGKLAGYHVEADEKIENDSVVLIVKVSLTEPVVPAVAGTLKEPEDTRRFH
jgi:hypothetical protein